MRYLFDISRGSGIEAVQCGLVKDFAIEHPNDKVYICAVNKYFADCIANELENVESIDRFQMQPLFSEIMRNKDNWKIFKPNVYDTYEFMTRQGNYEDIFREQIGMKRRKDYTQNGSKWNLVFNAVPQYIVDAAKNFSEQHPNFVIFQRQGGINPVSPHEERIRVLQQGEQGLKRAYPIKESEEVVKGLIERGYEVLQYCLPEEPHIAGAIYLQQEVNQLFYYEVSKYAKGVVCIDSSLMHLTVHNAPHITVIWAQTASNSKSVVGFGYDKADNLIPETYEPIVPYFTGAMDTPIVDYITPDRVLKSVDKWYEAFVEKKSK